MILYSGSFAQTNYRELLAVDPDMANGYVIIDQKKADGLNAIEVQVDAYAYKMSGTGEMESRKLGTVQIEDRHYGAPDPNWFSELQSDEVLRYHVQATDGSGTTVYDQTGLRPGGGAWPELCRQTCNSIGYAWTLIGYDVGGYQSYIDIVNGVEEDGGYFYFYVRGSEWEDFSTDPNTQPSAFGLGGLWSQILNNNTQVEVIHIPATLQMRGLNGYPINANYGESAYGIRKGKGPWENLWQWTENFGQSAPICDILVERYNSDVLVQNALIGNDPPTSTMPNLTCDAQYSGGTGNGGWPCAQMEVNGDLMSWVQDVLECQGISTLSSTVLTELSRVLVNNWTINTSLPMLDIKMPTEKDPKLVPVKKTSLVPGLYEFMLVLNSGRIIRHFEHFEDPFTVYASFASFVGVNVYPVPVKESTFAIDFSIPSPMDIDVLVVDNNGDQYYGESLSFEISGRNKHVVKMDSEWPEGLYHAIFTYADGSSETTSFIVDY